MLFVLISTNDSSPCIFALVIMKLKLSSDFDFKNMYIYICTGLCSKTNASTQDRFSDTSGVASSLCSVKKMNNSVFYMEISSSSLC